jgi:phage baseplate assembly protein gpV
MDADLRGIVCYTNTETPLGDFSKYYYFKRYEDNDSEPFNKLSARSNNTILELINPESITGYDRNGNILHPYIEKRQLFVPPNIYYGEHPWESRDYSLEYKITDITNPNNYSISKIRFRVAGLEYNQPSIIDNGVRIQHNNDNTSGVLTAFAPEVTIDDWKPESEKGKSEFKEIDQLPNGLALEYDGTPELETEGEEDQKRNAYFAIKHPEGSRMDMFDDGRVAFRSDASMQLVQGENLQIKTENNMYMKVKNNVEIETENFHILCNGGNIDIVAKKANIKGEVNIVGNVNIAGTVKVTEDVIASGVSLVNHTHGGVDSGPSNTKPPNK